MNCSRRTNFLAVSEVITFESTETNFPYKHILIENGHLKKKLKP